MAVKKYRMVKGEGHTSISNKVIKLLQSNIEALGLYTYLMHLPESWEFHKKQIREVIKVGINKLDSLLSFLVKVGLVKVVKQRDAKGCFAFFDMHVLDEPDPSTTMEPMTMEPMPMENSTYKRNSIQSLKEETLSPTNDSQISDEIPIKDFCIPPALLDDLKKIPNMTPEVMNPEYLKFKHYYRNHTLTQQEWEDYMRMWMLRAMDFNKKRKRNVR